MDPLKDKNGLYYYPEQPPDTRVAIPSDFSRIPVLIARNTPFLVLGWEWQVYQCYRIREGFTLDKIRPWLDAGRVFIFTGKTG
jgi:hypothetical protein